MIELPRFLAAAAALALATAPSLARARTAEPIIAIAAFGFTDTSGESLDQTADHLHRMSAFMLWLRHDLPGTAQMRSVALLCGAAPCGSDAADIIAMSRQSGADLLLLGAIHKMSSLVEWAKVTLVNVPNGRTIFDKVYTFRGDNDLAWQNAEHFISQNVALQLKKGLSQSVGASNSAPPVSLAVFPFELDDFSAGAAFKVTNPVDQGQIQATTNAVRKLLAQSGRYVLVNVTRANAEAMKTHRLRDCNGCDADIARGLGAQESLVGVVRRISQTEFTVRIVMRDSRTGATRTDVQSGLRLGAAYAWNLGAGQVVETQILARENRP